MPYADWQLGRLRQGLLACYHLTARRYRREGWVYVATDMMRDEALDDVLPIDQENPTKALGEALRRFVRYKKSLGEARLDAVRYFLEKHRMIAPLDQGDPAEEYPVQAAQLLQEFLGGTADIGESRARAASDAVVGEYQGSYDVSPLSHAAVDLYLSPAGHNILSVREEQRIFPTSTVKRVVSHGQEFEVEGFEVPREGRAPQNKPQATRSYVGWGVWVQGNLMLFLRHHRQPTDTLAYIGLLVEDGGMKTAGQGLTMLRMGPRFSTTPVDDPFNLAELVMKKIMPHTISLTPARPKE